MNRFSFRAALGALTLAFLLAACDTATEQAPASASADPAAAQAETKAYSARPAEDVLIPGRYIVVLAEESVALARGTAARDLSDLTAEVAARGAEVRHTYEHALTGFAAAMSADEAAALADDPRVLYVEQEQEVYLTGTGTQGGATWGLDRINARSGLDNQYGWRASGEGVTAYVIDTGINLSHNEFEDRASYGYDFRDNDAVAEDCNGHGTHVAGTVGGATYGVAKDVDIVAVRVFGCGNSGDTGEIIAGFNWVAANAQLPAVANASLGGGASDAMDAAARGVVNAGVAFAAAAGNGFLGLFAQNACGTSPAREPSVMTVSSTDDTDRRVNYANYGDCVDVFAPGRAITSAWYTSNSATNTIEGTSMASPHVAGAAALFLEVRPNATPAQVSNALFNFSTKNIVQNPRSDNAHLLYNGGSPSSSAGGDALTW
ncbi:MAG: S8 family serine peptidase [Bacteroidota bacterium]